MINENVRPSSSGECNLVEEEFGESSINGALQNISEHSNIEEKFGESSIIGAQHDTSEHSNIGEKSGESSISPNGHEILDLDVGGLQHNNLDYNGIRVAHCDADMEGGSQTASSAGDLLDTCLIRDKDSYVDSDEDLMDEIQAVDAGVTMDQF